MTAWILYSLALSALAGAGALAAEAAMSMYRRPTRWVWAAALFLSCAGPVFLGARPSAPAARAAAPGVPASGAPTPLRGGTPAAGRVDGVLAALWAGVSAAMLGGIAAGAAVLRRRRGGWRPARMAGVSVLVSPRVGPAVAGVLRPAIVVPRWTLAWPGSLQRLLVRHEGEHIRAGDPRLVFAATVAAALVPWNPAVWWQLRRLRLAVEVDCDARTLRGAGDVAAYGGLLLRVGALGSGVAFAAPAFAEPRSFLERRIRAMTSRTPRNRAPRTAALAALTLAVAGAGWALPAPSAPALLGRLFPDPWSPSAVPRDTTPVLALAEVDAPPSLLNAPEVAAAIEAAYPATGERGTATVELVVRADGTPAVTEPAPGSPDLVRAAYRAARQLRFHPARKGGVPVAVRIRFPVTFEPHGDPASRLVGSSGPVRTAAVDTIRGPAGMAETRLAADTVPAPPGRRRTVVADTLPAASGGRPLPTRVEGANPRRAATPAGVAGATRAPRPVDPTPELPGRAIDPNAPRVPPSTPVEGAHPRRAATPATDARATRAPRPRPVDPIPELPGRAIDPNAPRIPAGFPAPRP